MSDQKQDLLMHNVPNEVLNGIRVPDFFNRFGVSENEFRSLIERVQATGEIDYRTARSLREATEIVQTELTSDLQTRTGLNKEELSDVLLQLDAFLEHERGEL